MDIGWSKEESWKEGRAFDDVTNGRRNNGDRSPCSIDVGPYVHTGFDE